MQSLIDASKHGIRSRYELAEYLGVSERFLEEAIQYYKDKHDKNKKALFVTYINMKKKYKNA